MWSIQVCYLFYFCVGPKVFQIVVFALLGEEDVYNDVAVVHGDPFGIPYAVDGEWLFPGQLVYLVPYFIAESCDLAGIAALADNQAIGDGSINFLQIYDFDFFPFLFLDTADGCIHYGRSTIHVLFS